jgi:hypothetical protein
MCPLWIFEEKEEKKFSTKMVTPLPDLTVDTCKLCVCVSQVEENKFSHCVHLSGACPTFGILH